MTEQQRDPIEYLINAMEWAGMEANPAKHGYGEKRRAVFAAIVELRKERDAALAERSEQLMEMNCAVLERDAVLQRAEELAHELRQTAQASQHVEQRAEQAEVALAQAQAERERFIALLRDLHTFIRYARFELKPGESQFGDPFPRQGCADKRLAAINAALGTEEPTR